MYIYLRWSRNQDCYLYNEASSEEPTFAIKNNISIKAIVCDKATPEFDLRMKKVFDEIV